MAADKERDPGSASAEIGKYLDILAKDPNSRVFAPLAEAYRKAGFFDDAVETALEGLKVHPNYLGGRVALGRAYFEKKQYAEAAAEMQKVVKSAPDNIIAHKVLGQIAYGQSDLRAAEKAFKMVLLLDPRDQEAQQFVANLAGGDQPTPIPVPPSAPVVAAAVPVISMPTPASISSAPARPAPPPPPPVEVTAPPPPPPPPPPVVPPPTQQPFEEPSALDDLDLQAAAIFGDLPSAAPLPQPPEELPPSLAAPAPISLEEFGTETSLALVESEIPTVSQEPAEATPAEMPKAALEGVGPEGGMELEVFARVPWKADTEEESPFEVFGRSKRGDLPQSTKGERTAYAEINLESTADAPAQVEPEPASDSLFEVFTREPGQRSTPPPAKAERASETGPREIEIETTAYTPPDDFPAEGAELPVLDLHEELPRIDLTNEMDLGAPDEPSQPAEAPEALEVPESTLEPEPVPTADLGMDLDVDLDQEPEGYPPAIVQPAEPEILPEPAAEAIELGIEEPPPWEEPEEEYEEAEGPSEVEPSEAAGRGVFDTETLAGIYVNQGFYGRAAEIYQRLLAQRPDDGELRGKLEDVLALERGEAGLEEPVPVRVAAAQPKPAAAVRTGPQRMIDQLQALLETFKGGRPR